MAQQSERGIFEPFDASTYRVGIVCAEFNADLTSQLLAHARTALKAYGVRDENVFVYRVPGSVEIPLLLQQAIRKHALNATVALGVIIRGETPHFDYVAKIVSEGVLRVALDESVPVGFGVLTCENHEQAEVRVHAGADAVAAALHSARQVNAVS